MLNLVKCFGIKVATTINNVFDPYDDFKRPAILPPNNVPLHVKAKTFTDQLLKDFQTPQGLFLYNRAKVGEEPDFGDQAVHHGLALAALFMGNKVDPKLVRSEDFEFASNALTHLFENEKLIRGRDPRDPSKFADDASNDSATGAFLGIVAGMAIGKEKGTAIRTCLEMFADELIKNTYSLVRQDGTPTTYGKLINGVLTDPQRSALAMAILTYAGQATSNQIYTDHAKRLCKKYGALLQLAEFKFLDYTKSHESHRSAIHLHILAGCSKGSIHNRCVAGLERIWAIHRKSRDPWLAALVNLFYCIPANEMADVINRLHEYPVEGKPPQRETINSLNADFWKQYGVRFITVNGNVRATQPLPYHVLPTQDFWPQRHPYMCDGFKGENDNFVRHNAVDFLAPYYLLRYQGMIGDKD